MSSVDIFFVGQSNVFQTDTRTAAGSLLVQADVPAWTAIQIGVGTDLDLKVTPWSSLDSRYMTYSYSGSRQWCAAPEACVRRLVDTYGHSPRLFRYGVGASRFSDHWTSSGYYFTAICQSQIAAALASTKYAGAPSRRIIVLIHGESDGVFLADANVYDTSMGTVVTALRTTLGDANTHVIVTQLPTWCSVPQLATVRTKQSDYVTAQGGSKATLLSRSSYADSGDHLHHSQAGAKDFGEAIADTINGLL